MSKRPKEQIELTIQRFSSKGYGVSHLPHGDRIEVAHAAPGDVLRVEWQKKRHGPQKGRLLEILTPSYHRTTPKCSHVGICGGCSWQQIHYSNQLEEKMERIRTAFVGINVEPIIPCEMPYGYRNKMEFTFSENGALQKFFGLMIAQAEPYVFNLTECHLCAPWFAAAVTSVRNWWETSGLKAYNPPKDTGTLRYLTLREGFHTKQKMAVLNISGRPDFAPKRSDLDGFITAIQKIAKDAAIFLRIHQAKKGRPTEFFEMHLSGSDHILEELHLGSGTFTFKISPISFFQPNTCQAEKLYDAALSMLSNPDVVFDLYCGTGTLGMGASRVAKKVIGIELSPEAVLDAKENLQRNGIGNMEIFQGDVGELLKRGELPRPDAVIIDPPRAGLDPLALRQLKNLLPKKIIYISCNPLTQAANIEELKEVGYKIKKLQPVDQFPHTYHIENIALLEL